MRRRLAVILFCGAFIAACQTETLIPSREDDRKLVDSVISQFNSAIALNDSARVFVLFTEEGEFQSDAGAPMKVREAFRTMPARRLPWDERTPLETTNRQIRFDGADRAMVSATQSDSSPMMGSERRWSCDFVLVRVGQDWKIKSYRESRVT